MCRTRIKTITIIVLATCYLQKILAVFSLNRLRIRRLLRSVSNFIKIYNFLAQRLLGFKEIFYFMELVIMLSKSTRPLSK